MAFLDDFKGLDTANPGNWPATVQMTTFAALVLAIVGISYYFVWAPQVEELDLKKAKEVELKAEYLTKYQQAVNLPEYKKQLEDIRRTFNDLLKKLPKKSEMESLLTEVNQAGVGRGLLFDLFKPGGELKTAEMAELPIEIKMTGQYHDLAGFSSDVARLSRIVTFNNMQIKADGKPPVNGANVGDKNLQYLTLQAVAKTYRYLDEEEQAAQRKAEKAAKQPK